MQSGSIFAAWMWFMAGVLFCAGVGFAVARTETYRIKRKAEEDAEKKQKNITQELLLEQARKFNEGLSNQRKQWAQERAELLTGGDGSAWADWFNQGRVDTYQRALELIERIRAKVTAEKGYLLQQQLDDFLAADPFINEAEMRSNVEGRTAWSDEFLKNLKLDCGVTFDKYLTARDVFDVLDIGLNHAEEMIEYSDSIHKKLAAFKANYGTNDEFTAIENAFATLKRINIDFGLSFLVTRLGAYRSNPNDEQNSLTGHPCMVFIRLQPDQDCPFPETQRPILEYWKKYADQYDQSLYNRAKVLPYYGHRPE